METTNRVYGTSLAPLSSPPVSSALPGILPHYRQTTYPLQPRPKAQIFSIATLPSGKRTPMEKAVPRPGGVEGVGGVGGGDGAEAASMIVTDRDPFGASSRLAGTLTTNTATMTLGRSASLGDAGASAAFMEDQQVLRVWAYSQEGVPESADEAYRVRKYVIHYRVIDGSIEVFEPRLDNAGLPQGPTLKGKVPKGSPHTPATAATTRSLVGVNEAGVAAPAPEFIGWQDLAVGREVCMYGRVYHVYDADKFTRAWCAARGVTLAEAESVPLDAMTVKLEAAKHAGGGSATGHNKIMFPAKLYAEARLGKFIRDPEERRKFQQHDGKVLKFDGMWDDTAAEYGDQRHVVVQYFLSNDTAEVKLVHANNDGYGSGVALVRKGVIPRNWVVAKTKMTGPGGLDRKEMAELALHPRDLVIGGSIDVYGRKIDIRSCDPWTRSWYESEEAAAEYGCSPQPPNVEVVEEAPAPPVIVPPPHNGIGSEEDSLQSCYTFNVKPLRKDYTKWALNDGISYKFTAKLMSGHVLDATRRFVIVLFPSDDSMAVYESAVKNSGFKPGQFLRRDKHRKPGGGGLYTPDDFAIGTTVTIVAHRFLILDGDAAAREAFPHLFPTSTPGASDGAGGAGLLRSEPTATALAATPAPGLGATGRTVTFRDA